MTPEQLARKRENDRNAQRAIRARTKAQISQLQAELDALKSTPHACCRALQLRNQELECEVALMKQSLQATSTHNATVPTQAAWHGCVNNTPKVTEEMKVPNMGSFNSNLEMKSGGPAGILPSSLPVGCGASGVDLTGMSMLCPECGQVSKSAALQNHTVTPYTEGSTASEVSYGTASAEPMCPLANTWMGNLEAMETGYGNAGPNLEEPITWEIENMASLSHTHKPPFQQ
ncbi:hypothetical protein VFPPC_03283 [Pochonia chlamydosporia 170]|uniref:BZIP transcription factor domain-containing protein n=1 Tax=Pochonia chlamydosporia 170 TaxID=1380566 RepID=A0A179G0P2_METCM|nr:hypothetical protein VFPPC_03283 [Pochonia chlamydosporia 170]OAQ70893.1 hypothetical protein VFPPC_03283 [Pochonia chlamydosporia 170]